MKKLMIIFIVIILLTSCSEKEIYIPEEFSKAKSNMHMVFPYLGGGKAFLLELPTGAVVLIDCGTSEDFPILYDILRNRGIERIDYIILTSDTLVCTGGLQKISDNFEVGDIYISQHMQDVAGYRKICMTNSNDDCSLYLVCEGTRIYDDDGVSIDVVSSALCETEEGKNSSVSLYVTYDDVSVLYEGDGDYIAEREMVSTMKNSLKADVIVVPHRGTGYIPGEELLYETRPDYAVIPVYGDVYPREALIKSIRDCGAEILQTDRDGTISMVTDGYNIDLYILK